MSRLPKQVRLLNGKLLTTNHRGPLRPPKGCCEACYSAETEKEKCTCRCRGKFHGMTRVNKQLIMHEKEV